MTLHTPDQTPDYWELLVDLPPASEELWTMFCMERGATGCETLLEKDSVVSLRLFFDELSPEEVAAWPELFHVEYPDLPLPSRVEPVPCEKQDWQQAWRVHFHATPAGKRLLVCPPWEAPDGGVTPEGRRAVVIEPGQGFGTGGHASTMLALALLDKVLEDNPPPAQMMDVGIGSGILALASIHLGVGGADGVDIDFASLPEIRRNERFNGFENRLHLVCGGPSCISKSYPLVTANLTAPIQLFEQEAIADLTQAGGRLILSGMLVSEREEVIEAFQTKGFQIENLSDQDGWAAACLVRTAE